MLFQRVTVDASTEPVGGSTNATYRSWRGWLLLAIIEATTRSTGANGEEMRPFSSPPSSSDQRLAPNSTEWEICRKDQQALQKETKQLTRIMMPVFAWKNSVKNLLLDLYFEPLVCFNYLCAIETYNYFRFQWFVCPNRDDTNFTKKVLKVLKCKRF